MPFRGVVCAFVWLVVPTDLSGGTTTGTKTRRVEYNENGLDVIRQVS